MIGSIGHLDETRLGAIAEAGEDGDGLLATAERAHLDRCEQCRHLLEGHRVVLRVLTGPWAVREAGAIDGATDVLTVAPRPVLAAPRHGSQQRLVLPAVAVISLLALGGLGVALLAGRANEQERPSVPAVIADPSPSLIPIATIRPGTPPIEGGMVVRIDAGNGAVSDTIEMPGGPGLVTTAAGQLWVFNFLDGSVARIDPATRSLAGTLPFEEGAAIVADGEDLWIADGPHDLVLVDGRTGIESRRYQLAEELLYQTGDAGFLAVAGGSVWVTVPNLSRPADPHAFWRVDPATGRVLGRLTVGRDPHPPVVVGEAIYLVSPRDNTVTRIDARTNEVSDVEVGTEPYAIAAGAGSIWVGDERDLNVRRLDLGTMAPQAVIDVGEPVRGLAFGDGHLWVTTWTSVLAIDPVTNNVIGTTRLLKVPAPRGPAGLTVFDGAVWVGVEE